MRYMKLDREPSQGTVLLLQGKNFSGFYWKDIALDLSQRGYQVIIPDQIGWGKSSKPQSYQYSFAQLALNTKQLLEALGSDTVIVVGHSMGGMLATHFTHYYPDAVAQLILINPIGLESFLDLVEIKDPDFFYANELNKSAEKIKAYQQKNYYDGQWEERYGELLVPIIGQLRHDDWPRVAWNNALTYAPIFNESILPVFPKITQPISLIIGTRDRTAPGRGWKKDNSTNMGQYETLGKKAVKTMQDGRLLELEGLGHMPQFEDYESFSAIFFPLF